MVFVSEVSLSEHLAGEESFRQRPGRVGSTETQKDKKASN